MGKYVRLFVRVQVPIIVGPFDVPIKDWEQAEAEHAVAKDDFLSAGELPESAVETLETALAGALPGSQCRVGAYPNGHPRDGEWVPVDADMMGVDWEYDADIMSSEDVEIDDGEPEEA